MPRGVPENEVLAAADRVLARGERPTVERVRTELGRGSPARVGKLLEAWWDALAKRLAGETRLPDLPSEVATAFRTLWGTAVDQARSASDAALAEERVKLDQERAAIQAASEQSTVAMAASDAKAATAQRALELAQARTAELERLAEQQQAQIADLQHQRNALQERADRLTLELANLQAAKDAQTAARESERKLEAERLRVLEDRAHAEVDRARVGSKALSHEIADLRKRLKAAERGATAAFRRETALRLKLARASQRRPKARREPAKQFHSRRRTRDPGSADSAITRKH